MIIAKIKNQTIATIHIHGFIGDDADEFAEMFGITGPKKIIEELTQARNQGADEIEIRIINSPGGEVTAGFAIFDLIEEQKAAGIKITTYAFGEVASMSAGLFMVGEERKIGSNASLMIHNPWGGVVGDSGDVRKFLEELEKEEQKFINIFTSATGLSDEQIAEMMAEETFMNAEEADTLGFATQVLDSELAVKAFYSKIKHNMKNKQNSKPSFKDRMTNAMRALTGGGEIKSLEIALTDGSTGRIETEEPEASVDDILLIDDSPASEGEYTIQETNQTLTVGQNGQIESIEDAETEGDSERVEELENQVEALATSVSKAQKENNEKFDQILDALEQFGKSVGSNYTPPKRDQRHDDNDEPETEDSVKSNAIKNVIERNKKKKEQETK